jgi:hypothetical protein
MTSVNWTRDAAAHLLRRAGFGGTPSETDADAILGKAYPNLGCVNPSYV